MFALLRKRLLEYLINVIRSGEMTERGLARRLNASQPHIHNILKGIKSPSPAFCDHIIEVLRVPASALLRPEDLEGVRKRPGLAVIADAEQKWVSTLRRG